MEPNEATGALLYSLPPAGIERTRKSIKGLTLLVSPAVAGMAFLAVRISVQGRTPVPGLAALMIVAGFVFLFMGLNRWAALQEPLRIFESGVVPMERPSRTVPGRVLLLDDIRSIEVQVTAGFETKTFAYLISDREGRRYRVTAYLVSRYDRSPEALGLVYSSMENLRKKIGRRTQTA